MTVLAGKILRSMMQSNYLPENHFEIRWASRIDLPDLIPLSQKTFRETFGPHNTDEDIEKYLKENFNQNQLVRELDSENSTFYLAKLDGIPIGYLKVNLGNAQTEMHAESGMEVERIYILQCHQGKGFGLQLLNKAFELAFEHNLPFIWLGVWEKNQKAIAFYKKHGFREADEHIFPLGNDRQRDLIMRLDL
jgi:ribosomal protein S18 acetylase RimI-like enzyme